MGQAIGDVDHPLGKHELPSEPLASIGSSELGSLANIQGVLGGGLCSFVLEMEIRLGFWNELDIVGLGGGLFEGEKRGGQTASVELSVAAVLLLPPERDRPPPILVGDRRSFVRAANIMRRHFFPIPIPTL